MLTTHCYRVQVLCAAVFLGTSILGFHCRCRAADSDRWERAIRKFEESDRKAPPKPGGVLFIGSSSIRRWDLNESFPDKGYINRGFGGSEIADSTRFADRIVIPYKPRVIVLYAGDNDISKGKSPEQVAADFREFVDKVHSKLPKTRIAFIAIKPSIARWKLYPKMKRANELISEFIAKDPSLSYVDIATPMLGNDGRPRQELFAKDNLHLSAKGYSIWASLVKPHLSR